MNTTTEKTRGSRSLTVTLVIAFFTLSAVLLLVNGSLAIFTNYQTFQDTVYVRQLLIAENASKTVSISIEEKFTGLETAAKFGNPISASSDTRQTIMESLLELHPSFLQFALLDGNGRQLAQVSRVSNSLSPQFSERLGGDWITQTSHGQRYISSIYHESLTSEPLVVIAIPVTNAFGEYQGTLLAEVSLKFMWDLVDQLGVGKTGYVYVVDDKGNLIAYKDTALVLQGKNVSQIGEVSEFVENPTAFADITPGIQSYMGLNGMRVLGTYVPLESLPWAVVIELPASEAYQPVIRLVAGSIATVLFTTILAGLAGVFVARRLSAPLIKLSNITTQVASGNLGAQAEETGPTELVQLAGSFNTMTSQLRDSIGTLERRVAERTTDLEMERLHSEHRAQELQSISEISRLISSEQRLDILLALITRLVSERFDFYHVGIFFVDNTRQYAVLQAANSEGGQRMLAHGHRLEVGQTGIVGNVAKLGDSRIALDVGSDAVYFDNPDLPTTRSEMALPLKVHGETIGVLDVQSTEPAAFSENDAKTLSILADQIAIAIDNARLFGKNKQALDEVQSLYDQYLRQEWKSFIQKRPTVGYIQSIVSGKPLDAAIESDEIRQAVQNGRVVVMGATEKSLPSIAIPIKLRGQIIGVLNIKAPTKNRSWNQDEINLAQAVSDRLALALDNARLLFESQRQTAKEQKIGEVTAKIGASINMRNVLQTAVEELGRAMPGSEVVIQFQSNGKQE